MKEMERPKLALALGAFDGLHRGHRAVLSAALSAGLPAGAVYFTRSPSGEAALLTDEDREDMLCGMGFSRRYGLRFEEVRGLSAEEFAEGFLFGKWNAGALFCGEDFRFGAGAKGDAALLEKLCRAQGAALTVLPTVREGGEKIGSSRIRRAVEAGDIPLANRLLGRPFGFAGEVLHGNHLGTGMGTPTVNQAYPEGLTQPRFGVYAAWCRAEGQDLFGVCNIGVKPTVGSSRVLAETWLPDFSGDLYGKRVRLFLLDFIRPERKFGSLEELRAEILKNAETARDIARRTPLSRFGEETLLP